MYIPGIDVGIGYGTGLAATNAMAVTGIESSHRLLAVISFGAGGVSSHSSARSTRTSSGASIPIFTELRPSRMILTTTLSPI